MTSAAVDISLVPPIRDLGDGFKVRRALPSPRRQMVGPFVFFDQMGPVVLHAGRGLDVRPHPHIGLATVTYLFEGEILHRDSLGSVQPIRPGEVNWMTAGRGIVHSERTPPGLRSREKTLSGIQAWVALPKQHEEAEPVFAHVPARDLPVFEAEGARVRVIAGTVHGARAAVTVPTDLFYADIALDPGGRVPIETSYEERAAYIVEGSIAVEGDNTYEAGELVIFRPGIRLALAAAQGPARFMLLGGPAVAEPRYIWWNFVSSSKERIEQAKEDWRNNRFPRVPDESDFIPLPDNPPPKVNYP